MTNADAARGKTPPQSHTPPHASVEIRALGPIEAAVAGRTVDLGAPKQRALLALLASQAGRPVSVDVMTEELWDGNPPPSAMSSLQAYVANLRRVLEPDRAPRTPATVVRTRGRGYLLDSRVVDLDVRLFGERATAGWRAWDQADVKRALGEFEAGLALWRGRPYAEMADATCVAPQVAREEELWLSVFEGRCAALLAVGSHEVAVPELEAFVQAHPLREYGCELLSRALYRAGRQADALAVLRTIRERLAEELGIDPKPELQRLETEILNQAPALDRHPGPAAERPVAAPEPPTAPAPGPPPASGTDDAVFAGRTAELRQLAEALTSAAGGCGRVVTVSGEPGIGKTTLLRRFAEQADVPVLWATCPEHVPTPPLWLWEQVLHAADTRFPQRETPEPVSELLDADTQVVDGTERAAATLRRFEAVVRYLTGASDAAPLLVVLDHLHRADSGSLRLLAHLAGSVPASRLLVAVSYRSAEAASLAETLVALARAGMTEVELDGLSLQDTRTLASTMLDRDVGRPVAEALWARTEGNPFFLREMIKQLAGDEHPEQTDKPPVPAPVREVVLRRVARLPPTAGDVLAVAAIAGRLFDIEVVAEAAGVDLEAALRDLDAAIAAGLVEEDPERMGWFRFTHALTAEVLHQSIGRLRRARLNRRIAAAAARAWTRSTGRVAEIVRPWPLVSCRAAHADPEPTGSHNCGTAFHLRRGG